MEADDRRDDVTPSASEAHVIVEDQRQAAAEPEAEPAEASEAEAEEEGAQRQHRLRLQALNRELRMATVEAECCLVPSLAKQSAADLAAAHKLAAELNGDDNGDNGNNGNGRVLIRQLIESSSDDDSSEDGDNAHDEAKVEDVWYTRDEVTYDDGDYCRICYTPVEGKPKFQCCILVCDNCVGSHIHYTAMYGRRVYCPAHSCRQEILPEQWSLFLDEEKIASYLEKRQAKEVDRNPNARWCPNPKCGKPVFLVPEAATTEAAQQDGDATIAVEQADKPAPRPNKKCVCSHCSTSFCRDCSAIWSSRHRYLCTGEDTAVKRWALFKNSCRCPFCKSRIEKESGCNHMTCAQCNGEFCWLCRRQYEPGHFNEIGGCPGLQYSPVNIYGRSAPVRAISKTTIVVVGGALAIGLGAAACGVGIVGVVFYGAFAGGRHTYRVIRRMRDGP